ncbi:leucyl aminopeptidase family protein [Nitratireductor basaltis]|uniref:Leucyl aminopeptidase n=1 Tax=Nitratireductor basaltis TaxID=472175 RepID=A0A084U5X8_9HYPH|nr:leucyl aminopeptidase family protein [Nitratireductor basaltis]KFB08364.1 Leucyl aminopeptidase [Nitratireductor basaltis]
MPVSFSSSSPDNAVPVYLVKAGDLDAVGVDAAARDWAGAAGYEGEEGEMLLLPGDSGRLAGVLFGISDDRHPLKTLSLGALARKLPEGRYRLSGSLPEPELAALSLALGGYSFTRYGKKPTGNLEFVLPDGVDAKRVEELSVATYLTRDLINTPASDMGPEALEAAAARLAEEHDASFHSIRGDALLEQNLPMIHAVGRASDEAPRLIDFSWGRSDAPKVTLVGKGVCFDTGGLDIKPASGMLLMKKDMGGAANVLGLASMLMASRLDIRLRVLIPAVENSIAGNAFRPGDILRSRKGITVEIGNTDAEGRLVLADALALADEEEPDVIIDMATLTGAARVALGPDLPPYYSLDDTFAAEIAAASEKVADPLWRMPLWQPYMPKLSSRVADTNNITADGFAGSITAALFLQKFVEKAKSWAHFDVFGWNPVAKPTCPIGGEAQGIRALEHVLRQRYGR